MDVTFVCAGEESFKMEVGFFDTVHDIKQKLQSRRGWPAAAVSLFHNGDALADAGGGEAAGGGAERYGIVEGSVIHVELGVGVAGRQQQLQQNEHKGRSKRRDDGGGAAAVRVNVVSRCGRGGRRSRWARARGGGAAAGAGGAGVPAAARRRLLLHPPAERDGRVPVVRVARRGRRRRGRRLRRLGDQTPDLLARSLLSMDTRQRMQQSSGFRMFHKKKYSIRSKIKISSRGNPYPTFKKNLKVF